ncbi:MAG: hypothetical protein L6Q69_16610, partial [Zoogloea sp.]|nr:hypothetical protein [Zoogloea sp.]
AQKSTGQPALFVCADAIALATPPARPFGPPPHPARKIRFSPLLYTLHPLMKTVLHVATDFFGTEGIFLPPNCLRRHRSSIHCRRSSIHPRRRQFGATKRCLSHGEQSSAPPKKLRRGQEFDLRRRTRFGADEA